jgi:hypothetical protein
MVDNETCDTVQYEGYVQPTCFDEVSMDGRVPFSSDFVPDPVCKKWVITCNDGPVAAINVQNGGSGYTASFPVAIVGSGGGATGTANVAGGVVVSITVDTPGSGYTSATADLSAGDGVNATATVDIEPCSVQTEGCAGGSESVTIPVEDVPLTLTVCKNTIPLIPATASVEQVGHCICDTSCTGYEVTNIDSTFAFDVYYIDCNTQEIVTQSIPALGTDVQLGGPTCPVMQGSVTLTDPSLSMVEVPCA